MHQLLLQSYGGSLKTKATFYEGPKKLMGE